MAQPATGTADDPVPVNEDEEDSPSNQPPPSPSPSSHGDLTDEQRLTLIQFQEIVAEVNEEESLQILQRHNWNLEIAVQSKFNENEGLPPVYTSQPSVPERFPTPLVGPTQRRESDPTQVDLYRQNTWLGWLTHLVSFPLSLGHAGFSFCYHCISGLLLFLVRIVYPTYRRQITNPVDDILKFKKEYEDTYGSVHPTFYLGSYSQVLSDAKKELKFIVVYLHSKNHQNTADFCHTVLSNPGFTEYINGNMLFWACDVSTNEGYKVSRAMRETTYPFLAIVCLRDNRMTIVWRIEGPMGVDELISVCAQVIDENEPSLIAARTERQARSQNQELRNDQDSAYQESLRRDREKERELELKREAERKEEEMKQRRENEKLAKAEELAKRREECRHRLELLPEPSPTDVGAVQIRVNLPSRKLQRYFLTSDKLQVLYDMVLSYEDSPSQFILNTNFPKKTYPAETSGSLSLLDLGITKPTVFFVHDTLEGSSSDEE